MKKIMAVLISIIALGAAAYSAFMIFLKPETTTTTATKTSEVSNQSSSSSTSDSTTTTSTSFKDGTYTGASTSTEWGDVQLQITVSSTYPNDKGKSVAINQEAIPAYTKEAISNQSADIQAISGATETYKGFTGSLQDAINQAQKGA